MNIHTILVRSETSGNIGAAARAVANMGGGRLILIDPRCEINSKARQLAAGAQDQLRTMTVYASWAEFYASEGDGLRIALTRRGGGNRKVLPLKEQLSAVDPQSFKNLYLIFGPESDGLDSSDLAHVNFACHLPVYGEFGSLNLAQAVLLALYVVRDQFPPTELPAQVTDENAPAVQPLYFPDELIKEWLTAMGFDVNARRASAFLTLRRLFLQNLPTQHEIQVLEAVLQQNIRKLKSLGFGTKELTDHGRDIPV
ncbi:MAG: TrmH family RNA methyltransferase [Bdellovibrionales bacterium]|nr:TrmH family RNA methyltransferase [Bdellovibrionales bacterium]